MRNLDLFPAESMRYKTKNSDTLVPASDTHILVKLSTDDAHVSIKIRKIFRQRFVFKGRWQYGENLVATKPNNDTAGLLSKKPFYSIMCQASHMNLHYNKHLLIKIVTHKSLSFYLAQTIVPALENFFHDCFYHHTILGCLEPAFVFNKKQTVQNQ